MDTIIFRPFEFRRVTFVLLSSFKKSKQASSKNRVNDAGLFRLRFGKLVLSIVAGSLFVGPWPLEFMNDVFLEKLLLYISTADNFTHQNLEMTKKLTAFLINTLGTATANQLRNFKVP